MGRLVDQDYVISCVLAFFPVVAISTNLSTRFLWHKASKKNQ
jgi:hypothetical protein